MAKEVWGRKGFGFGVIVTYRHEPPFETVVTIRNRRYKEEEQDREITPGGYEVGEDFIGISHLEGSINALASALEYCRTHGSEKFLGDYFEGLFEPYDDESNTVFGKNE